VILCSPWCTSSREMFTRLDRAIFPCGQRQAGRASLRDDASRGSPGGSVCVRLVGRAERRGRRKARRNMFPTARCRPFACCPWPVLASPALVGNAASRRQPILEPPAGKRGSRRQPDFGARMTSHLAVAEMFGVPPNGKSHLKVPAQPTRRGQRRARWCKVSRTREIYR